MQCGQHRNKTRTVKFSLCSCAVVLRKSRSGKQLESTEETCKFTEIYREYSLLWDPSCVNYKNRFKRMDALKETGKLFNITPDVVDRKQKYQFPVAPRETHV
jgi:hypothetical protein